MNQESSGDPKAINLWDSNARAGTPSKGLMQVIDPTFAAYRDKGLPNDIWNPLANIVASMRYAKSRYGSLSKAYDRPGGYWTGGLVGGYPDNGAQLFDTGGYLQPGWTQVLNATGKPEPVFTPDQLASGRGVGGPLIGELNIPLHGTDVTAGDVIDEIMWGVTRIEHGGKFAGRSN
jgi:SLT domain-containing protein